MVWKSLTVPCQAYIQVLIVADAGGVTYITEPEIADERITKLLSCIITAN
jgi:hypothetical protein